MALTLINDFGNFAVRTMKAVPLSICLFFSVIASAQDSLHVNRPVFLSGLATYDAPESYGLSIGASIPFRPIVVHKIHQDLARENQQEKFVSAEFSGYRRSFGYTAIQFNAGVGIRYIKSAKHFTEVSFQQGILRSIYDGNVYQLQPDGNIKELRFFGRTYLSTGFSYSLNWSVCQRNPGLWFFQLRPSLWAQYPYNSFVKLHLSIQAGISYRLKNISLRSRIKNSHTS
jgi:hypothetical protein